VLYPQPAKERKTAVVCACRWESKKKKKKKSLFLPNAWPKINVLLENGDLQMSWSKSVTISRK
jgi:hypothetical protein